MTLEAANDEGKVVMTSKLLRAVIVTNHGRASEGVVFAMESYPWHGDQARVCDELCRGCHRVHSVKISGVKMTFDFEARRVYPTDRPDYGGRVGLGPIPPEDLPKFNADFGLYYVS